MKRPNIIIINCDDLGYGDLGCYGSKKNKTPAIDKLACDGIRFTNFYMASSVCSPSRAALLTGCYPKRIGFSPPGKFPVLIPGEATGLNPEEITIAGILKERGYSTKMIGKWHCGDQPEFLPANFGFDSYYGLPYSNDMGRSFFGKETERLSLIPDILKSLPPLPLIKDREVMQEQPDQSSLTERYVEQAISFIRENKDKNFFLYLAHMHVHLPHYVPQRFLDQSDNGPYGAAVECIDWATDAITYEIKRQGIDNDTVIIFTSDNGSNTKFGGSNTPLRGKKGTCWEGGFRVPFIIRYPEKISGNRICDEIMTSMDILPTIARLSGSDLPEGRIIDGKDMSGLLFDSSSKSPRNSFFYYFNGGLYAVRSGKWKYFSGSPDYSEALYNLDEDISESNNLVNDYPDIRIRLNELMEKCRIDLGDNLHGTRGTNVRPGGKVTNPKTLTEYNPDNPYIMAMYDLSNDNWG